jgi:glycosyltransferase involved in cell wall biosynthesis
MPTSATRRLPSVSIVIPAHDESQVIDRCLTALLADAAPGEFDVIVACNGCTDDTAVRAGAHGPDVRVLELPDPGKAAAMNAAAALARTGTRIYLDADVTLTTQGARATVDALHEAGVYAAAPRLRVDYTGRPHGVRAYYRIWSQLPYVTDRMVGSGVIGLSAAGQQRLGAFPDAIADDYFALSRFTTAERRTAAADFTIYPPRRVRDLLRRKVRSYAGLLQLRSDGTTGANQSSREWVRVVRDHPSLLPGVPVYLYVSLAARFLARRKVRRGAMHVWERDESSRWTDAQVRSGSSLS